MALAGEIFVLQKRPFQIKFPEIVPNSYTKQIRISYGCRPNSKLRNQKMRYFIELAYKGTPFCGWQIQPNAPSVQANIEKVLSLLLRQKIEIVGSSRTDTGVHAKQQFAHFQIDTAIEDPEALRYRANKILPPEIYLRQIYLVANDFHSRFDAISRKYEYHIRRQRDPFSSNSYYVFRADLDINKMNEACKILFQYNDFEAFSKIHTQVNHFRCEIQEAFWEEKNDSLIFYIKADRFLRGMVRTIVGTLFEIGQGRMTIEQFD